MLMSQKRGFSLVEVNLAIMLVALGMLVLFSLFPAGLSQGARAHADTQAALFGGYVLNTIRANAARMTWADWDPNAVSMIGFADIVLNDSRVLNSYDGGNGMELTGGSAVSEDEEFPIDSGNYIRYVLDIQPINDRLWAVSLWVRGGRYGPSNAETFQNRSKWFYTELFYSGMP